MPWTRTRKGPLSDKGKNEKKRENRAKKKNRTKKKKKKDKKKKKKKERKKEKKNGARGGREEGRPTVLWIGHSVLAFSLAILKGRRR